MQRRSSATTWFATAVLALALAVSCATTTTTETAGPTGSAGASGSTATTPDTSVSRTAPPNAVGDGTTPTTCVSAPATTGVGTKGGGEIICSLPDDSRSSPPMTDTTIPGPSTSIPQPDAAHGVVMLTTGGSPCPASAQVCTAMFVIVPARVRFERTDGPGAATGVSAESDGNLWLSLDPGTWRVSAAPLEGDRVCSPIVVALTAGQTTSASIDCALPG